MCGRVGTASQTCPARAHRNSDSRSRRACCTCCSATSPLSRLIKHRYPHLTICLTSLFQLHRAVAMLEKVLYLLRKMAMLTCKET